MRRSLPTGGCCGKTNKQTRRNMKRQRRTFVKLEINIGHLTLEQSACKGKTKKGRPFMGNFHPAWGNNRFDCNAVDRL